MDQGSQTNPKTPVIKYKTKNKRKRLFGGKNNMIVTVVAID